MCRATTRNGTWGSSTCSPCPTTGSGWCDYEGVDASLNVSYDRVPKGSAELRRASAIVSADGRYLGGLKGFRLDDSGQITEVVLDEGHLWRRRRVTIPVGAVQDVETDAVTCASRETEVKALPSERVRRWF